MSVLSVFESSWRLKGFSVLFLVKKNTKMVKQLRFEPRADEVSDKGVTIALKFFYG